MATLRGRAAFPIHPGKIVKLTLLGRIPLVTGELVEEAAITDIFGAYKGEVARVNELRPREKRIHGMRYSSFYTMFRFSRLLGLVQLVREEPMLFPPPGEPLLRIEKREGKAEVQVSTRKIFKLTETGALDEKSWSDLTRAWKEQWPRPQPLFVVYAEVPLPAPPKPKVKLPPKPPIGFTPYEWHESPSVARFKSLLAHMRTLHASGLEFPGVREEVDRLSMLIGDWSMAEEDDLEEAQAIGHRKAIERHELRIPLLEKLLEALDDRDLETAISALEDLAKS